MLFTQLLLLLLALAAGTGTRQDPPSRSHCWGSLSFLARRHTEVFFFCTRPAPAGGLCRHQEMLKMHSGIEIGECVRQGVMRVGVCECVCEGCCTCGGLRRSLFMQLCQRMRDSALLFGQRQQDKSMFYVMYSYQHRMRSHMKLKAKILSDEHNNRGLHERSSCGCLCEQRLCHDNCSNVKVTNGKCHERNAKIYCERALTDYNSYRGKKRVAGKTDNGMC